MFTGQTLLHADTNDNAASAEQLRVIAEWRDADKAARLEIVHDLNARHLLSLLLYRDPALRPSAARLLEHPFLTGRDAVRLSGTPPEFDVFLSYRVKWCGKAGGHVWSVFQCVIFVVLCF